ncbi:hypothetical protein DICPUDRAFT_80078 [Dictyostelium purpureum]|uniref:Uncharacterized protein n=1 Tax=Dictyostelium purpureum TaxID=5786 RepID=F0ZPG9_DICPU|nr:uncharacterized protein DICPUDRAFT_80078 [Dictyostelium purpureum]EGC34155.1 hypothetical protein DICPUDRAFT_80078 [Dictyostelium purpureum]|eukprot:XP_003289309.1 hypothetical protein DICPUDRAFT_80078 [Dictyostelium purpureum]
MGVVVGVDEHVTSQRCPLCVITHEPQLRNIFPNFPESTVKEFDHNLKLVKSNGNYKILECKASELYGCGHRDIIAAKNIAIITKAMLFCPDFTIKSFSSYNDPDGENFNNLQKIQLIIIIIIIILDNNIFI